MFGFKKAVAEEFHTCDFCGGEYDVQITVSLGLTVCDACVLEKIVKPMRVG